VAAFFEPLRLTVDDVAFDVTTSTNFVSPVIVIGNSSFDGEVRRIDDVGGEDFCGVISVVTGCASLRK
jgi:hypothetical protein